LMRRLTLDESIQLYELMYSYIKEGDLWFRFLRVW
jgi:hypothetical protein